MATCITCVTRQMTEDLICLILTDDKHEALKSTPAQGLKISQSFFLYFGKLFIF